MINGKTAVIHQPDFLPYLGFFHRLLECDIFVILDTVQFVRGSKESWQFRDKIKTPQGPQWITVGVQKCPLGTLIKDVKLQTANSWREKMMHSISQNYRSSPHYKSIRPFIEEIVFLRQIECMNSIGIRSRF